MDALEGMMISPIGKRSERVPGTVPPVDSRSVWAGGSGFTLVELLVVMSLMVVVISISIPSLAGFFHGRSLDSEAQRLLSLSRYGASRATSEGLPVVLWVDTSQRAYGLEQDSSYADRDAKAEQFQVDDNVRLAVTSATKTSTTTSANRATPSVASSLTHRDLPAIRFLPNGSVSETSFQSLQLQDREGNSIWLVQSTNGFNYELRSQQR
jgi:type II secretion system protein H